MLDRRRFVAGGAIALAASACGVAEAARETEVRVLTGRQLGRLPAMGLGFSLEKNVISRQDIFVEANTDFTGCCRRLGAQVFRVGGNNVDLTQWDAAGRGGMDHVISPKDIAVFAKYVKALGWTVIYGLNLAQSTPAIAAEEARAAAEILGPSLMAFEIGNEPNFYPLHKFRPEGYSYAQFLAEWLAMAKAVHAAVPDAAFCGPGSTDDKLRFALPFARDEHTDIRMLTQHYYRGNGTRPEATAANLFGGLPDVVSEMRQLVDAARAAKIPDGFRMVETNSYSGGGSPGVSDAMAAALWTVEYVLRAAEVGVNGMNFQLGPMRHTNSSLALEPRRIAAVRPEFYALTLLAALGTGTMLATEAKGSKSTLSAFAVQHGDERLSVVLNNVDGTRGVHAAVTPGGARKQGALTLLTASSLRAKDGITLGGATIAANGSGTPVPKPLKAETDGRFLVDVPPASAAWIAFA